MGNFRPLHKTLVLGIMTEKLKYTYSRYLLDTEPTHRSVINISQYHLCIWTCNILVLFIYYCKIPCNTAPNAERRHTEWAKNLITFLTIINRLSSSNITVLSKVLQDFKLFYDTEFLHWSSEIKSLPWRLPVWKFPENRNNWGEEWFLG